MEDELRFNKIKKFMLSYIPFKLYLIKNLPMGFLAGMRVRDLSEQGAAVTIPYKYLTKNPFRSMYFACLAMAAEMSSGAIGMSMVYKAEPKVSMLVRNLEGEFTKKAVGLITFRCNDGMAIRQTIDASIATGEGKTIVAKSIGTDETGDVVAEFKVTWSFKVKST